MIRPHLKAKVLLALASLLLAARPLAAGEPLGTDLFGGYSYLKLDDSSRHGANLAVGFRAFGPVAGFVDVSSHWGSEEGVSLNDLTLMAGPGVRFGKRGGTLFFVRALAGLVRDKATDRRPRRGHLGDRQPLRRARGRRRCRFPRVDEARRARPGRLSLERRGPTAAQQLRAGSASPPASSTASGPP